MAFLSPVVGSLLNLIGSTLLSEYARINGISDKLQGWGRKLRTMQSLLDSAEEKQMHGDRAADQWLSDLREVVYDMEDLLDHFSVQAKRDVPKLQAMCSTKLPYSLISCCFRIRPRTLLSGHHMANEIEEIDRRLKEIDNNIPALGLVQNAMSRQIHEDKPRFVTTSLREPKFFGREKQMEELLVRLMIGSEESGNSGPPFTVVSIVGMGGLGKTTLAQELYDKATFEFKAWVCVSDVFDISAITRSILVQVAPSSSGTDKDLNQLQNLLKEKLSGNKFLIVLDDVWNDNYLELGSLLKPLYSGSKGSRILLTTRNLEVAKSAGDSDPCRLDVLTLEECLSLLAYHSIGEESFVRHPRLQGIATKIAEKCEGLPLSIKTIGGVLRFVTDDEKWERVLAHGIWGGEDGRGKIPPALKLSYVHLPVHLKRCFAAAALFPKDYMFDQDEVIRLWTTQGMLHKGTAKTYREVGMENLRRLEAVSLFQKARDEKTRYAMHDLVNDLAKSVVAGSYFSSDEYKEGTLSREERLGNVRHAAMVTQYHESFPSRSFEVYRSMKKLRTFMSFQISEFEEPNVFVSQEVISDLIMGMKNLRMLSLRNFRVKEVPDWIGELKLLRSVDFSYTEIEMLPDSICDLVELQFLLLRGCPRLKKLPRNLHKLIKLLHLDLTGTDSLEEMPPHIGELTDLEILSSFVVGREAGQELKQLGPLMCIQRELHVRNLSSVVDVEDARTAHLSGKEGVLELLLDWGSGSGTSCQDVDHQFMVLDLLQPPKKIDSLAINGYWGKRFPSWFSNQWMNNVMSIILAGCVGVESMPTFGQLPSLERLVISGLGSVSSIGTEFYGGQRPFFRSLKSLIFEDMGAWENWSSHGDYENENERAFPRLRQLTVKKCPKLNGGCSLSLPSVAEIDIGGCNEGFLKCLVDLTSLSKMDIRNIPELVSFEGSFSTSWVVLEEMRIQGCPRFKSIVDGDCKDQLPPKLKKLVVRNCGDLEKLPDGLSEVTSLKEMSIGNCKKLSSFPETGLPPGLRRLELGTCRSLPQSQLISIRLLEYLEELSLTDLEGLVSIEEYLAGGTPFSRSLRELSIWYCESLTSLPESLQHMSALSDLFIGKCPEMEMKWFPVLPCNLSFFKLKDCPEVKCLPPNMHDLQSLKELSISDCPELELECFPALPCNLSSFELKYCQKVKCLPPNMHDLKSLKELYIWNCQGIRRLPRGGLPPNLEVLEIGECEKLNQPIEEWGLRGLTALRVLSIRGGFMECVDEMECFPTSLLPPSLLELEIGRMEKLERVAGGVGNHLTSLRSLSIIKCSRMRWLPEEEEDGGGLPPSLETIYIWDCPLLKEKCRKPNGEYCPLIRRIPRLHI